MLRGPPLIDLGNGKRLEPPESPLLHVPDSQGGKASNHYVMLQTDTQHDTAHSQLLLTCIWYLLMDSLKLPHHQTETLLIICIKDILVLLICTPHSYPCCNHKRFKNDHAINCFSSSLSSCHCFVFSAAQQEWIMAALFMTLSVF